MDEARFIDIESRVAYQEVLIQELNNIIFEQQKQIDIHEKKITQLVERVRELIDSGMDGQVRDEAPPHY